MRRGLRRCIVLARKIVIGFGLALVIPALIHNAVDILAGDQPRFVQTEEQRRVRDLPAGDERRIELQAQIDEARSGFETERRRYSRIQFFIGVPLALAVGVVGAFVSIPTISAGLLLGSIWAFVDVGIWRWADLPPLLRTFALAVGLVGLIWVGHKRLEGSVSSSEIHGATPDP